MMIQPNELRIGNYFNRINRSNEIHLPTIEIFRITEIHLFEVKAILATEFGFKSEREYTIKFADLYPVELAFDIFLKFGFSNSFGDWFKIAINDGIDKEVFEFRRKGGWFFNEDQLYNEPKYLHQLQNLHFALIGKELEINEPVKQ